MAACQSAPVIPTQQVDRWPTTDSRHTRLSKDGTLRSLQLRDQPLPSAPTDEAFGRQAMAQFGAASDDDTFVLERDKIDSRGKHHMRFRQMHLGIPVDDRTVDVHFRDTRVSSLTGAAAPADRFEMLPPNAFDAEAIARAAYPGEHAASQRVIWARVGDNYHLAVEVVLRSEGVDRRILIDGSTGGIIAHEDRMMRGKLQGFAYPINNVESDRAFLPLANLTIGDQTTDSKGEHTQTGTISFDLKGPYVDVLNADAERLHYQGPASANLSYGVFDAFTSEISAFIHVNEAHDWFFKRFGFTGLDHVVTVKVRDGDCMFNAYAQGDRNLRFGVGCGIYDYAQSVDYVYHEYGHLVTTVMTDMDYSTQTEAGAFNEGQSDYWACTMTNDERWGENPIHVYERHCDNDLHYERDYKGEAHNGAPLYSSSMWDVRKQFGADVTDALAMELYNYLPRRPTFVDVRDAAIEADHELFADAHADAIRAGFARHGIDDDKVVFITTDVSKMARAPIDAIMTAHTQGFDRATISYEWTFEDGTHATGDLVRHTIKDTPARVTVKVSDGTGATLLGEKTIGACNGGGSPSLLAFVVLVVLARRRRSPG